MVIKENKLIAKNTIYLYIRMFITMAIGLYVSRVILHVLGASDYGLYNVVGGIVTLFTMMTAALQVGTERFLNFNIGECQTEKLKKVFSISFGIYIGLSIIILLFGETLGLWFLIKYLNVPDGRQSAAFWVYQFTLFSFVANLLQIPFQSCIIAHEHMTMYAIMSIFDAFLKLFIAILLSHISTDRLIMYAALIFSSQLLSNIIYNIYCRKSFYECTLKILWDKKIATELIVYSSWNLLGGFAIVLTNQGINILLNIFFGTIVNAARGLAFSVSTIATSFVNNFQIAANPQIIKRYAKKEYTSFYSLIMNDCRMSAYLSMFLAIPVFIKINFILELWLGTFPHYTDIFVRIILLQTYFTAINAPLQTAMHASGHIKWISIINSSVLVLSFPLSYFMIQITDSPISVFVVNVFSYAFSCVIFLLFCKRHTGLSIIGMIKNVYLNTFLGTTIMFIIT